MGLENKLNVTTAIQLVKSRRWSVAQLQLGSALSSVAQIATRAHTEVLDLGLSPWLAWSLGDISQQGPYRYGGSVLPSRAMMSFGSRLLLRAMPGSVAR